jgi:hypothetical protein
MKILYIILFTVFSSKVMAHGGEVHSSAPSSSSLTKSNFSSNSESPFSVGFKLRSGYEYGVYVGALPSVNSYFGSDELNLNLNYEFQLRQFNSESQVNQSSEYQDQDYNNRFSAQVKKTISEKMNFYLGGEYGLNQAVRLARMINDYNYYALNSSLTYQLQNEWSLAAGYLYGVRQFPNGTYTVPTGSSTGIGEPISPTEQPSAGQEVTLSGVTDNSTAMTISYGGELGQQILNFEGKYTINNSDLNSRKYNGQSIKLAMEKMLFARIYAQLSYAIENRVFSERVDKINSTEIGLQKELSARMTVLGLARNTQLTSQESISTWEGYAQLQYAF